MKTVLLGEMSFELFAKLVKTKFQVWLDKNDSVELELIEATPPRRFSSGGDTGAVFESFSLVFVGPADRLLEQRSYPFESDLAGRFELFIVPVGRDPQGIKYEAAFNRRLKAKG